MTSEVPIIDRVCEALFLTCDVLEEISCRYFLAGGTLLGAMREGDLIAHDVDFDLDCLAEDESRVLESFPLFEQRGLAVRRKFSMSPVRFDTLEPTQTPLYSCCLTVEYKSAHVGDLYMFTVFSDGIARRFDLEDKVYYNPKMALPAWFYSGESFLSVRGRWLRSVQSPEVVIEKIYGPDWRIPQKPGEFAPGRTPSSGSVPDADLEYVMMYARDHGWKGTASEMPLWPQPIAWVGWPARPSIEWINRHEPLVRPELASYLSQARDGLTPSHASDSYRILMRIVAAKAIQSEANRHAGVERLASRPSFIRRIIKRLVRICRSLIPWCCQSVASP